MGFHASCTVCFNVQYLVMEVPRREYHPEVDPDLHGQDVGSTDGPRAEDVHDGTLEQVDEGRDKGSRL